MSFKLYTLYLSPTNAAIPTRLYIDSSTSSLLVRTTLTHQLRIAAEQELLKTSVKIDIDDLYAEADKAFEALSTLLGEDEWFFQSDGESESSGSSLFDASVFAYTHLLLDEKMGWRDKKLTRAVRRRKNLMDHRDRLLERYWGSAS